MIFLYIVPIRLFDACNSNQYVATILGGDGCQNLRTMVYDKNLLALSDMHSNLIISIQRQLILRVNSSSTSNDFWHTAILSCFIAYHARKLLVLQFSFLPRNVLWLGYLKHYLNETLDRVTPKFYFFLLVLVVRC